MRWFAVEETRRWRVFRQTPDRACEGGVRFCEAKARVLSLLPAGAVADKAAEQHLFIQPTL